MRGESQHILVSYDISDPKRLIRVGKLMKNYGERVLKSVFECNLSQEELSAMRAHIEREIDHLEDSVRFYILCGKCVRRVEVTGLGLPYVEDEEVIIA